jgi:hypothetical protein
MSETRAGVNVGIFKCMPKIGEKGHFDKMSKFKMPA